MCGRVVAVSQVVVVQQGDTTHTLMIELEPTDLSLRPGWSLLSSRDRNTHETEHTKADRTGSRVVPLGEQKHQDCYGHQG